MDHRDLVQFIGIYLTYMAWNYFYFGDVSSPLPRDSQKVVPFKKNGTTYGTVEANLRSCDLFYVLGACFLAEIMKPAVLVQNSEAHAFALGSPELYLKPVESRFLWPTANEVPFQFSTADWCCLVSWKEILPAESKSFIWPYQGSCKAFFLLRSMDAAVVEYEGI